jgi:arabinofuranosyltransferase
MNSNPNPKSPQPGAALFIWCVVLVLSACVVALAFRVRQCFVDDAFTGFQYIANLLAGHGFVFYPGDAPVEGVSNIGWLLALAPWCVFAEPTMVAKLAGLALVLMSLILTVCLGRNLAVKVGLPEDAFGLAFPPALMLVASFEFVYFSLAGMETALLATLLLLMACIALGRPQSLALPVLGAFAFMVHPEAVVVYPLYAVLCWFSAGCGTVAPGRADQFPQPRAVVPHFDIVGNIVLAVLVGGITAARLAYFHDVLPNTFYSKPSELGLAIQNGYAFLMAQNTNVAFPITGWLAAPVLLLGYLRLRRSAAAAANMLAAICVTGLALAIYCPPDWTALARYFAPYLPAALILLWAGLIEAIWLLLGESVRPRTRQAIAAFATLVLTLTSIVDGRNKMAQMGDFPGYVLAGKSLVEPALWMRDHLPERATIATRRIGALAYYSHRKPLDYAYGLPDREVARLVARQGRRFDSPADPALAAVWRARSPDYLLEDGTVIDYIVSQAGGVRDRFPIHGIEYRVIKQFPIGRNVQWVLAQRIDR